MKENYNYRALRISKEATKKIVKSRAQSLAEMQRNIQWAKRINRKIAWIVFLPMLAILCWLYFDKKVSPELSHFIIKTSMESLFWFSIILVICNIVFRKTPGNGFLRTLQKKQREDKKKLRRINRTLLNPQYLR